MIELGMASRSCGALRALATCAAFAAVIGAAPAARASCRSVTTPVPADYDAATKGCFEGDANAKYLFWKNTCVGYSLQKDASDQVPLDAATAAVDSAFNAWHSAGCGVGGHPSIAGLDQGPVACTQIGYGDDHANQHLIVFRDDVWPHSDPNNTLALTTVTFDTQTGEIYDADMEINSTSQNKIVVKGPIPDGAFDFASIVLHEAGHFLGLAHSTSTSAIMYAHYKAGSPQLTSDDVAGICTIYPGNATRLTSAGSVPADQCDPMPRRGFGSGCDDPPQNPEGASTKSGCAVAPSTAGSRQGAAGLAIVGAIAFAFGWRRARRRARAKRVSSARLPRMKRVRAAVAATFLGISAISAASFTASDAHASVSIAILFDELVRDATAAAGVTPIEQNAVWEDGRIYTYTRVHVDSRVAGPLADDEVWIRTMGGVVGKIGQIVEGEAVLTVGRPSLLFLQPHVDFTTKTPTGTWVVTARAQGQFPIALATGDKATGLKVIQAGGVGALMPPSAERIARMSQFHPSGDVPKLAQEVLHNRSVEDATREIAAAWTRVHATTK